MKEFADENADRLSDLIAESGEDQRSIGLDEEFTYWLFNAGSNSPRTPSRAETRRGLDMMFQMDAVNDRRVRMLKDQDGGALLEFGLVKPRRIKSLSRDPIPLRPSGVRRLAHKSTT